VQTFLPYADFEASMAVLDSPRLGKQRVETLQICRALALPDYGWSNHPAVVMWRGRLPALVLYGLVCVAHWRSRGHADSTEPLITEFAPQVAGLDQDGLRRHGWLPSWVGDERLHSSHRSALLRKDPARYRPVFGDEPDDQPYFWPGPDSGAAGRPEDAQEPETGRRVWVVRPANAGVLGRFLTDGVVGMGVTSGLDVDLTGVAEEEVRAVLREVAPGRRPGKQLRQLRTFLHEVALGDEVAVPVQGERALLVGTVTGDYTFAAAEPSHRRTVRWHAVVPREDVRPAAALQDPRELFAVRLVS
jgi:hypothetical protein